MIHGIGVDLVEIHRISESMERFGSRFAKRILNDNEYHLYDMEPRRASFLAKRFAAKEAMVKALGTGFRQEVSFKSISIENNELGRPFFRYSASMQSVLQRHGITRSHLSIADERDYALAYVVLETS